MQKYVTIEKLVGETPLSALESFRRDHVDLADIPMTYAGRLDPMASGKLLILCGDECKNREAYDGLDKEYEFEVLLGVSTDTGDVLGLPRITPETQRYSLKKLSFIAGALRGEHTVPYPVYSSKTVGGIPLFEYAQRGTLHTIEIPTTQMRIHRLRCESVRTIRSDALLDRILAKIVLLQSDDFRSDAIGKQWSDLLKASDRQYALAKFTAVVGAGTYIRTLASMIGKGAGTDGIAYSIHRSGIGRFRSPTRWLCWWGRRF